MSKKSIPIDFEYDYDFLLLGICSPMKEHTLCYHLNKLLNTRFKRAEYDINMSYADALEKAYYALYEYWDEQYENQWYLLANKCKIQCEEDQQNKGTIFDGLLNQRKKTKLLIPENNKVDFFIQVHGIFSEEAKMKLLREIKTLEQIVNVHQINMDQLRSKENLII